MELFNVRPNLLTSINNVFDVADEARMKLTSIKMLIMQNDVTFCRVDSCY